VIAPLPTFLYALAVVWAITFANDAPTLAIIPAVVLAVLGFAVHLAGTLSE
jgi:hypothetical protein